MEPSIKLYWNDVACDSLKSVLCQRGKKLTVHNGAKHAPFFNFCPTVQSSQKIQLICCLFIFFFTVGVGSN